MIVGSFSQLNRVDGDFIKTLVQKTSDKPNGKDIIRGFWGFSEIADYQGYYDTRSLNGKFGLPIAIEEFYRFIISKVCIGSASLSICYIM